jgi:hypothetical protein
VVDKVVDKVADKVVDKVVDKVDVGAVVVAKGLAGAEPTELDRVHQALATDPSGLNNNRSEAKPEQFDRFRIRSNCFFIGHSWSVSALQPSEGVWLPFYPGSRSSAPTGPDSTAQGENLGNPTP